MDILEIGNGGLTAAEERTMMAIWCVSKSPLLLGNDLSKMTAATLAVVGNEQLIVTNHTPLYLSCCTSVKMGAVCP
jgi:alpha-galactosidase